MSGVAVALKARSSSVRVVAVEPELAGDLAEGFRRGERVVWDSALTGRTIADGLRTSSVGKLNWRHIHRLVDDVVTVTERADPGGDASGDPRISARLRAQRCRGGGGFPRAPGVRSAAGPAVAVVSGGNVSPDLLARRAPRLTYASWSAGIAGSGSGAATETRWGGAASGTAR